MKYASVAVLILMAGLVGLVLIPIRPASGQSLEATPAPELPPGQALAAPQPLEFVPGQVQRAPGVRSNGWHHDYRDPELAKLHAEEGRLEHETAGMVEEYARTMDESQRGKIKAKLTSNLEKQFELQQKRRDLEVAQIEAQLKKLREIMRKRGEARQTIIDKRLDQLLREADGLGWTPPPGTAAPGNAFFYGGLLQAK